MGIPCRRWLHFRYNYDDFIKLQEAIKKYPGSSEEAINEYLRNKGSRNLIDSTTFYIPVSKTGKHHAKSNNWYNIDYKNLEVDISNSLEGTRKTGSFYYLYYVSTFTGTSDPSKRKTGVGGIDFFEEGADKVYPIVKDELLNILETKIKEGF